MLAHTFICVWALENRLDLSVSQAHVWKWASVWYLWRSLCGMVLTRCPPCKLSWWWLPSSLKPQKSVSGLFSPDVVATCSLNIWPSLDKPPLHRKDHLTHSWQTQLEGVLHCAKRLVVFLSFSWEFQRLDCINADVFSTIGRVLRNINATRLWQAPSIPKFHIEAKGKSA